MRADAGGYGDLTAAGENFEHQPQLSAAPPRMAFGFRRDVLLQVAREERAVALEFA